MYLVNFGLVSKNGHWTFEFSLQTTSLFIYLVMLAPLRKGEQVGIRLLIATRVSETHVSSLRVQFRDRSRARNTVTYWFLRVFVSPPISVRRNDPYSIWH